jgi:flavin-binding protein dodecin
LELAGDSIIALKAIRNQTLKLHDPGRDPSAPFNQEETLTESVYKFIELVGTSTESWEKAANAAVERASKSLRDLRIAEISQLDLQLKDGKIEAYRAKVKLSFKYEGEN